MNVYGCTESIRSSDGLKAVRHLPLSVPQKVAPVRYAELAFPAQPAFDSNESDVEMRLEAVPLQAPLKFHHQCRFQ